MLIGQASINLTTNVLSALFGLASVFVFTRLPHFREINNGWKYNRSDREGVRFRVEVSRV